MAKNQPGPYDVLYGEMQHVQRIVTDLSAQVGKIHRHVNIDQREYDLARGKSEKALLEAVNNNTEIINELLLERRTQDMVEHQAYEYQVQREQFDREASKRRRHLRYLMECEQKVTKVCPCGAHKGIAFLDDHGDTIEEWCPRSWWVSRSRIAFEDKTLSKFVKAMPLDKYLAAYKLAS